MLIFGDSWTVGLAASDSAHAYPAVTGDLLGWDTIVAGESGSGYLRSGELGGSYPLRVLELDAGVSPDVIVLQGSINDRFENLSYLPRAATTVWDHLMDLYPDAHLVVLGPAPHVLPVPAEITDIDSTLSALADAQGLDYISPLDEEWITAENFDVVIDTSPAGAHHPSDQGHALLATRLAGDLAQLVTEK